MTNFNEELLNLIRSNKNSETIKDELLNYHESDIAAIIPFLNDEEKIYLFKILGKEELSKILPYTDNIEELLENISDEKIADIVELMDSDDAVDTLQELDKDNREHILSLMEEEAREDAELILSYNDDEIGSKMTTNYIIIDKNDSIKQAMRKLIAQAQENDNISTILVEDDNKKFFGAVDLKDLICASKDDSLEDFITKNYPFVYAKNLIEDCLNDIKEYSESTIPVLNYDKELIGVITANDLVEVVDEELTEDFHKFAAVTSQNDIEEGVIKSMSKRVPWLILLLFLGLLVSIVISNFDVVIATLPVMVFFQSLVLDMAGNSGTQSLAVTIRALTSDEINKKERLKLIFREVRVGLLNGMIVGILSFVICLLYLMISKSPIKEVYVFSDALLASFIVGISLLSAMTLSSFVGTLIPMFFKKIGIDPAVASGPLITTINDVVAVICYYGLTMILFSLI